MATGNITVTTAVEFIQTVLPLEILAALKANLVLAELVTRLDSLTAGKEKGNAIKIPHVSEMEAKDKTANVDMTAETFTEGETTLDLDKHKYAMFEVEDIVTLQSKFDFRAIYVKEAAAAIAKKIDSDISAAMYASATNSVDATTGVTWANLRTCRKYLQAANVPPLERYLVLQSDAEDDVMNLAEVKNRGDYLDANTPGVVQNGRIGRLLACDVFATENLPASDVSAVSKTHNLMFQKGGMALAIQQQPRVEISRQHKALAWAVSVDVVYGVKVMRGASIVDLQRNA